MCHPCQCTQGFGKWSRNKASWVPTRVGQTVAHTQRDTDNSAQSPPWILHREHRDCILFHEKRVKIFCAPGPAVHTSINTTPIRKWCPSVTTVSPSGLQDLKVCEPSGQRVACGRHHYLRFCPHARCDPDWLTAAGSPQQLSSLDFPGMSRSLGQWGALETPISLSSPRLCLSANYPFLQNY